MTTADIESHRLLKSLIEERFPDLSVVMEEQANPSAIPELRREDFVWVGGALELIRGGTALFVNPRAGKIWDFAAAALAMEEASGIATSVSGEPLCWSTVDMGVVLAANPAIAEQALSLRVAASEAVE